MTRSVPAQYNALVNAYDDVTDWLVLGADLDFVEFLTGQSCEETVVDLLGRNVTHVLDLREGRDDRIDWIIEGLPAANYCHAPIIDSRTHTPDEAWFRAIEDFVDEFWTEGFYGDRLYVHCQMGVNRGPSAAMLALLTVEPEMHPWQAFMQVRDARPAAGLVYAEFVGRRHLQSNGATDYEFVEMLSDYWTKERIAERRQIRFDATGGV